MLKTNSNNINLYISIFFTIIIIFYGNFYFRAIFTWLPSVVVIFIATLLMIKHAKLDKIFFKVVVINSIWLMYALLFSFSVLNFEIHIKAIVETFLYILVFSIIISYLIKDIKKLFTTMLFSLNIFLIVSILIFLAKEIGLYDDGHSFASLYSNRNTYAFMALVYLTILLNLPTYIIYKYKIITILLLLFFILITGSSKGILGVFIIFILHYFGKYSLKKIIFILPIFFIFMVGLLMLSESTEQRLIKKIDAISKYENNYSANNIGSDSGKIRIFLAIDAIDIFLKHPLAGVGVNNGQFYLELPKTFETQMESINSQNNITEMLLNVGWPGFLMYYLPLVYLLFKAIQSKSKYKDIKVMVVSFLILKIFIDIGMKSYNDAGHIFIVILAWFLYSKYLNIRRIEKV